MNKLSVINTKITALGNAEKVTKAVLAELSRELLDYVMIDGTHDIAAVNRTIGVLTPVNRKVAIEFFGAFTSHKFNEGTQAFGGKDRKKHDAVLAECTEFLADETNNIWTWADKNIDVTPKPKDYFNKLAKLVEKALSDESEGILAVDVVNAILAAGIEESTLALILAERQADRDAIVEAEIAGELPY
jgi:hypothetical protein